MAKTASSKSRTKLKDNEHTFVKNRGGFHPETDESLRAVTRPGQTEHDYEDFEIAQGGGTRMAPSLNEDGSTEQYRAIRFLGNIVTIVLHPVYSVRAIMRAVSR